MADKLIYLDKEESSARKGIFHSSVPRDFLRNNDYEIRQDIVFLAREFNDKIVNFVNIRETIPADGEKGSEATKNFLKPYTTAVATFRPKEARHFVKLLFGENHLAAINKNRKNNSYCEEFFKTLEKKAETSVEEIILGISVK